MYGFGIDSTVQCSHTQAIFICLSFIYPILFFGVFFFILSCIFRLTSEHIITLLYIRIRHNCKMKRVEYRIKRLNVDGKESGTEGLIEGERGRRK